MHIFMQEINKNALFLPCLCDILLKSLHYVKCARRTLRITESYTKAGPRNRLTKVNRLIDQSQTIV